MAFSKAAMSQMQQDAQPSYGTPMWALSGKKALIAPGQTGQLRLLPRWDQTEWDEDNPVFEMVYFQAWEHWWDGPDGRRREWCPLRTYGPQYPCPICEVSEALKKNTKSKQDADLGKSIASKSAYLFNAVAGKAGERMQDADGTVSIRPLSLNYSQFQQVLNFMTVQDEEEYRELINPALAHDLRFKRPMPNSGDRWVITPSKDPTPLWLPKEADAFATWMEKRVDLAAMVANETLTYDQLAARYYNTEETEEVQQPDETGEEAEQTEQLEAAGEGQEEAEQEQEEQEEIHMPPASAHPAAGAKSTGAKPPLKAPPGPVKMPQAAAPKPGPKAPAAPTGVPKKPVAPAAKPVMKSLK